MIAEQVAGPGVPTSTVRAATSQGVSYCVSRYAPSGRVIVRNERSGATATIRTNNRGSGCTHVPGVECGRGAGDRLVASGTGADGNPATSSATVTAAATPACAASPHHALSGTPSSHGRPLSGADAVLLGVAAAVILALAAIGVLAIRRRRAAPGS